LISQIQLRVFGLRVGGVLLQELFTYRRKSEFSNSDDYAVYVREHIVVGMQVCCCQTYEEVRKGDVGTVVKVSASALAEKMIAVRLMIFVSRKKTVQ